MREEKSLFTNMDGLYTILSFPWSLSYDGIPSSNISDFFTLENHYLIIVIFLKLQMY